MTLPAGTRLGEYEVLSLLGVGGFGIVYLAFDHALEREVAVKEYMPGALAGRHADSQVTVHAGSAPETFALGLRSFVNEAKMLARFDHPSLLKVYRFWEANGTAYMAMPVLLGRTLKQTRVEMSSPPDEAWLRGLLNSLLGAVQILHEAGVLHRDIAPDNVQIAADGHPILMDFGAARRVLSDTTQDITAILKPSYAPIEQYAEAGSVRQGPWTDIYSLGATLHYVLVGRPPPPATTRVVFDDDSLLTAGALPGYSDEFLRIVEWMLQSRPTDRPQSVAALCEVLDGHAPIPNPKLPRAAWLQAVSPEKAKPLPDAVSDHLPAVDVEHTIIKAGSGVTRAVPPPTVASAIRWPGAAPAPQPSIVPPTAPRRAGWLGRLMGWWPYRPARRQEPLAEPPSGRPPSPAPAPSPTPSGAADNREQPPAPPEHTQVYGSKIKNDAPMVGEPLDHTVIVQQRPPNGSPRRVFKAALTVQRSEVQSYVNRVYPLAHGETLLGRAGVGLALPDPSWSAQHARIVQSAEGIMLTDLDSLNGTFVNGIRLVPGKPCRLHLGASIQIGSTLLALSLPETLMLPDMGGSVIAGRYVLKECLQSSPKGVVYRAEKKDSGVAVAIKILSPDYADYPGYRERFSAEAQIASRLQHPHICRLDDFGETEIVHDGRLTMVPYSTHVIMTGGSLADRHSDYGKLPIDTVLGWLTQASEALDYAHRNNVIHGNLKPSTICFDGQSNLYVTDFAIAGRIGQGQAMVGTPAYMAPEQWEAKDPTSATDQYALGAIAYFLITGFKPYEGQEDPEKREHNLTTQPAALHAVVAKRFKIDLPPAVSQVVAKAMSRQPSDRYASLNEFAVDFARALKSGRSGGSRPVFLSYRRDDSAHLAIIVEEQLSKQHGIASFLDTQGRDAAGKFPERIARAIRDCQVFVCILGPTTLQSNYVVREVCLAHELGKPMIPVFQENDPPEIGDDAETAVKELLIYEGVPMADKRPFYVRAAIAELAERIEATVRDLERGA